MRNLHNFRNFLFIGIVIISITSASEVKAGGTDRTWDGSTNTDWNTAANWSGDKVPTNKDRAIIPSGLSNYPSIGSSNYTVKQIKSMADGTSISGTGILTIDDESAVAAVTGTAFISCSIYLDEDESSITCNGNLTISGVISGVKKELQKAGTGTLTLSGLNTYLGSTWISNGTLSINTLSNFGTASSVGATTLPHTYDGHIYFDANATLIYTGTGHSSNRTFYNYDGAGTIDASGSGALILSGDIFGKTYGITLTGSGEATQRAVISGTTISKEGSGSWTLSGTNTFTEGTTISAGTLNINNAQALGTVAGTFTISGGTLNNTSGASISTLNYPQEWNNDFIFTGSDNLNLGTGSVSMNENCQITVNANTLTIGGTVSAADYNLTKSGAGTLCFGSNPVSLQNLTISEGTLCSTSDTIHIASNFSNSGTFTHNSGTIDFNGTATQNIIAATYNNLTIHNKSSVVSLSNNATVNGNLVIKASAVLHIEPTVSLTVSGSITNTPGTSGLVLKSDATGSATLIHSGSVSGTVQRYVPVTSSALYHYVSSPVASLTINSILDAGLGNYNAYKYDPSLPGGVNARWTRVFASDTMVYGVGYTIPYTHASTGSKTISYEGTMNASSSTVSVNNTNGYFHLLGNPFTAPISVSSFLTGNSNLNGAVYYWDDNGYPYSTSDYAIHNGRTSIQSGAKSNAGQSHIGIGQGFIVQSNGTGASTVSFDASWRTSGETPLFFTPDPMEIQVCKLSVIDENESYNQIAITMQDGASKGYDRLYDAAKLKGNPNIAFYSFIEGDTIEYAIQGLPFMHETESVSLGLDANIGGSYTIELDTLENFDPNTSIYLEDKMMRALINLREKPQYSFRTSKEILSDRFVLHFARETIDIQEEIIKTPSVNIFVSRNQIQISNPDNKLLQVDVYDVHGKKITSRQIYQQSQSIQLNNAHGYYIVKVYNGTSSYQEKVFLK